MHGSDLDQSRFYKHWSKGTYKELQFEGMQDPWNLQSERHTQNLPYEEHVVRFIGDKVYALNTHIYLIHECYLSYLCQSPFFRPIIGIIKE